jgi:hypothetical protein
VAKAKFSRINVTFVVLAGSEEAVIKEVRESLDLIGQDHTIFTDEIWTNPARRPETAGELLLNEEDDG